MAQTNIVPTVVEGDTINLKEILLDDFDDPILPHETTTGVEVILYDNDEDRSIIAQGIATPDLLPGQWQIDFSIPYMDLEDSTKFQTVWKVVDDTGQNHQLKSFIVVEPGIESRDSDAVYFKQVKGQGWIDILLPFPYNHAKGERLYISAYLNNQPVFEHVLVEPGVVDSVKYTTSSTRTNLRVADCFSIVGFEPYTFMAQLVPNSPSAVPKMYNQNLWVMTPQVMVAISQVESYINKARIDNVIPSLDYTMGDMITYLHRGLNMFNQLPPHITGFTGMNMQGHILEAWVNCASFFALSSQIQAEGALAFDFSGQTVSLNVDRTPAIEGAIGRIESYIDQRLLPYKKLLVKAGHTSGDGSAGRNQLSFGNAFGKVRITNAPTTKLGYGGTGFGGSLNGWVSSPSRGRR